MRLAGMGVIVAGVGGIGSETARRMAREGAAVWCIDKDAEAVEETTRVIRADGGVAEGACCDATDHQRLGMVIDAAVDSMGHLDALVTTVGGAGPSVSFLDVELADWTTTVEINLTAAFVTAQLAARHMVKERRGSLVLTSSQLGLVALRGQAAYCAAKGGVNQLVKVIANDLAKFNVRANALAPGPTWTPSADRALAAGGADPSWLERQIPLRRWGSPADMASAAVFLASDESSFVTGTTLVVDGGYTSH